MLQQNCDHTCMLVCSTGQRVRRPDAATPTNNSVPLYRLWLLLRTCRRHRVHLRLELVRVAPPAVAHVRTLPDARRHRDGRLRGAVQQRLRDGRRLSGGTHKDRGESRHDAHDHRTDGRVRHGAADGLRRVAQPRLGDRVVGVLHGRPDDALSA